VVPASGSLSRLRQELPGRPGGGREAGVLPAGAPPVLPGMGGRGSRHAEVTSHKATHTSITHTRVTISVLVGFFFLIFYYFCHEKYKQSSLGVRARSPSPPGGPVPPQGALVTLGSLLPVLGPPRQMAGARAGPPGVQLLLLLNWGSPWPTHTAGARAAWTPGSLGWGFPGWSHPRGARPWGVEAAPDAWVPCPPQELACTQAGGVINIYINNKLKIQEAANGHDTTQRKKRDPGEVRWGLRRSRGSQGWGKPAKNQK